MSSKTVAAALLLVFSAPVFAQAEVTFGDIASANRELKYQELRNKLSEAKAKNAPALPAQAPAPALLPAPVAPLASRTALPEPVAESAVSKMQLVAIYGVGRKLSAEIQYNGSTHTVRSGGDATLGDWTVDAITPYSVVLSKPGAKGKKGESTPAVHQALHIASEPAADPNAGANASARRQGAGPMDFASMASPFGNASMPRMPVPQLPAPPAAR